VRSNAAYWVAVAAEVATPTATNVSLALACRTAGRLDRSAATLLAAIARTVAGSAVLLVTPYAEVPPVATSAPASVSAEPKTTSMRLERFMVPPHG
jgi:hypothetical protein